MCSPRETGEYFVMLCYKNGAVARELVRDQVRQVFFYGMLIQI
jgi:hypothetical protein